MRAAGNTLTAGEVVEALILVHPDTPVVVHGQDVEELFTSQGLVEIGLPDEDDGSDKPGIPDYETRQLVKELIVKLIGCKSVGPMRKVAGQIADATGIVLAVS
jgi:hypothetical protein